MTADSNMPEETKTATKSKTHKRRSKIHKRRMRLFFAVVFALWIFIVMTGTILVFYLTQNPLSFSLVPTLASLVYCFYRLAKYFHPMNKKEYELRLAASNKDTINKQNNKQRRSSSLPSHRKRICRTRRIQSKITPAHALPQVIDSPSEASTEDSHT